MARKLEIKMLKWRNSRQIAGVKAQLTAAINCCDDGAYVQIDIKTARNLAEVCDRAAHTEKVHGV